MVREGVEPPQPRPLVYSQLPSPMSCRTVGPARRIRTLNNGLEHHDRSDRIAGRIYYPGYETSGSEPTARATPTRAFPREASGLSLGTLDPTASGATRALPTGINWRNDKESNLGWCYPGCRLASEPITTLAPFRLASATGLEPACAEVKSLPFIR